MTPYKIWLPLDSALASALYRLAEGKPWDDYARDILRAAVEAAARKERE